MKPRFPRSRGKKRNSSRDAERRHKTIEGNGGSHSRNNSKEDHHVKKPIPIGHRKINHSMVNHHGETSSVSAKALRRDDIMGSTTSIPSTSIISAYSDTSLTDYDTESSIKPKSSSNSHFRTRYWAKRTNNPTEEITFRPEFLLTSLEHTLSQKGLNLQGFLNIFRAVMEMFTPLGPVFSFVVAEMKEKIDVLDGLRQSEARRHYETVEGMVKYETELRLVEGNNESGVKMQQRLQRSLPFITELLTNIDSVDPNDYLYQFVRDAYYRTLAGYHSWIIRKTITIALRALPKRQDFETNITKSDPERLETWRKMAPTLQRLMNRVHAIGEDIYAKYNVPQIP
ncbi:unnamed protein product [Notodromas monacha]|uniref:Glycolipid transfer protein domain-containing protein n=1 Tax=Notodromas monacha TaxID=399045 RepID=A0A7R9BF03_9CRUS|nr:unnamed protein product [Notodromas monacha]CAG0912996.1 unnamed protein product [Notodromas monacha]